MSVFSAERLEQVEAKDKTKRFEKYTILVVDDEENNLQLLQEVFDGDYEVITAHDGMEALDLVQHHNDREQIRVIISDQRMPAMNGVDFLEQTIPLLPNTKRIILTGFTDVDDIIDAINKGQIYQYIVKPFINEDLRLTVQRALEAYQLEVQNLVLIKELTSLNTSLERKVEERTDALQHSLNSLRNFYYYISHELRTPLTAIQPYIRFLQRGMKCDPPTESQTSHLLVIEDNTKRVMKLVNQILDLARIESQELPTHLQSLLIHSLIRRSVKQLHGLFRPEVEVVLDLLEPEAPVLGTWDDLETVVDNLISNAAKYTETGTVQIKTEIWNSGLRMAIQDTGVGIDVSHLGTIFERFIRVDQQGLAKGTGLGLHITKALVERMGGRIGVTSEKGTGSTFWVWLQLAP